MLKKFFLNALSAFVGAWAAIVLMIVAGVIFLFGIIGSFAQKEGVSLSKGSVLVLKLKGEIEEVETAPVLDYSLMLKGKLSQPTTLNSIVKALESGKNNSNIEALLIQCDGAIAAPATFDAIRRAVLDFKKSGKRVFAYGDSFTMGDYFVATAADELFLNPCGNLDLQGISGTSLYFKDFLDKIGISFEVVRVGTYKSAVEPFISNEMSEPARLQLDSLYSQMWGYIRDGIATSRKLQSSRIDSLVNRFIFLEDANAVLENKLVDKCVYKREVNSILAKYLGKDEKDVQYFPAENLAQMSDWGLAYGSKKQIAVLYAVGDIAEFDGAGIYCEKLVPIITRLADNENVKGLVLRVNSPGGSVFGSEQIGEALDYFKSKGKKLAVSMGDYAASGGYWISACADRIFADPLSITGSIGIFGLVPNAEGLTEKIGIHPQTVSTNPGVNFPSIFHPMSELQRDALQKNVERGYDKFISRVASGRNKSKEYIESIASGRVWDAVTARKLGLVDELGGLENAISWIADKSQMGNSYEVAIYPKYEPGILNLIPESVLQNSVVSNVVERMKKEEFEEYAIQYAVWFLLQNNVQARALDMRLNL